MPINRLPASTSQPMVRRGEDGRPHEVHGDEAEQANWAMGRAVQQPRRLLAALFLNRNAD